jgi:hypothetical protein
MTDEGVQEKFRKLAIRLMGKSQIDQVIEVVNNIEKVDDIGEVTKLLVV